MSDIRRCDGPDCDVEVSLDEEIVEFGKLMPYQFISMDAHKVFGKTKHFHNQDCMRKWTLANTKGNQG